MGLRADYESADSTSTKTVLLGKKYILQCGSVSAYVAPSCRYSCIYVIALFLAKALLRVQLLDVNDNHPKFSELHYTQDVWKSSTVNSPVLRINATDIDEGLNGLVHYEVVSGNFNETFLFEDDGMVFLKKSLLYSEVRVEHRERWGIFYFDIIHK